MKNKKITTKQRKIIGAVCFYVMVTVIITPWLISQNRNFGEDIQLYLKVISAILLVITPVLFVKIIIPAISRYIEKHNNKIK